MPTWWSNQTNSAIITLAAIATIDQILSGILNLCRIDKFLKEYITVTSMKVFFKKNSPIVVKFFFLVLKLKFKVFDIHISWDCYYSFILKVFFFIF